MVSCTSRHDMEVVALIRLSAGSMASTSAGLRMASWQCRRFQMSNRPLTRLNGTGLSWFANTITDGATGDTYKVALCALSMVSTRQMKPVATSVPFSRNSDQGPQCRSRLLKPVPCSRGYFRLRRFVNIDPSYSAAYPGGAKAIARAVHKCPFGDVVSVPTMEQWRSTSTAECWRTV